MLFHRIIEPVENDFGNAFEYSLAWMHYVEPPAPQTQAEPAVPKQVYCMFTQLARGSYAPCLEVTITGGPSGTIKKTSARFQFQLALGAWLAGAECSLDGGRYKSCSSGKQYRGLDAGKHVFKVRGKDSTGEVGKPAKRSFKVKKKRKNARDKSPTGEGKVAFATCVAHQDTSVRLARRVRGRAGLLGERGDLERAAGSLLEHLHRPPPRSARRARRAGGR